ncbi:MAG: transglycosylase domain-containing protein [Bacteroidales bacterium]|nr:transglycosylase domain-containing protein [Bacteroidales bacterium]MCL2132927.1 transglycosylase domain-containing protein [Bacteroidales bacterium]
MKFNFFKVKNRKRFNLWFFGIIFLPFIILALILIGLNLFGTIPSFEELENPKSKTATQIISEDGILLGTFHVENRSHVSYDELSLNIVYALIATEDIRFHGHSGIDFRSLGRVLVKTILGGSAESGGGSTISQQLAKNLFPRDSTITRSIRSAPKITMVKLKEWVTAVKLERNYTKEEIIAMYLNTVEFGSNAFGIRAAAATFFAKLPSQLKLEEAALLIGVINAPSRYSPVRNPDRATMRRNHVLSQMNKYGFIAQQTYDSLSRLPITLTYMQQDHNAGHAPYFREMLRRTMLAQEPQRENYRSRPYDYDADKKEWDDNPLMGWIRKNPKPDGSLYDIDRDGLKIYTTINSHMQQYAEEAVTQHLKNELQPPFSAEVMRYRNNPPFSNDLTRTQVNSIMEQAKRWSDRYRNMKRDGATEEEIDKSFQTKTKMTVFAWNSKGQKDTIMTPLDSIRYYKSILRAAFMAMDVETGQVRAYVGGPNYRHFKYDNASQGRRQVGSTIKPFLYTLAMQEGFTPCDKVLNVSQTFILQDTTWTPATTDRAEWIGKTVTLKWGLTKSSNNISAYLMKQLGPLAMVNMCKLLGIKSYLDPVVSLCLGPADLYLTEMVGAYGTFANKGVHNDPLYVTRIEDKNGNLIASFNTRRQEGISRRTAYLMVNLLQGVVNEGTAFNLRRKYIKEGELAGKTGTTNNQSDGWFVGFVPKLAAGVWVGAEDRSVHFQSLAQGGGANMALPIWGSFMEKVLADPTLNIRPTDTFEIPADFNINLTCTGSDEELDEKEEKTDDFF